MRLLLVVLAVLGSIGVALNVRYRGVGTDVLLPPGTQPDWRDRARRNAV